MLGRIAHVAGLTLHVRRARFAPRGRCPVTSPIAAKIMIIRHAEKPLTPGAPFGVAENGTPGDNAGTNLLTVTGWTRAGALAAFFAPERGPLQSPLLAKPEHLFAAKPKDTSSHRPHDTLLPLSRKLRVDIDASFGQDDIAPMIDEAMSRPGVVLICWEHKRIRKITARIPRHGGPPDRFHFPRERYDVVFVFDLDGDRYRFSQVAELLLDGDSPDPIDVREVDASDLVDDD